MVTLNMTLPWIVCTPTVFRYLPSQHVDQFFADGSLRLSCFAKFRQHADEQRLDAAEGEALFVHRTQQGGGQTITARADHGLSAYVLSAAVRHDTKVMEAFKCDSYLRINDPTAFGTRVARHIPGLLVGAEGLCLYQENKIIERDLGYIDLASFIDPSGTKEQVDERTRHFVTEQLRHYPCFLKHAAYAHQQEYRFVWITSSPVQDFLDIKVPEAISFCSRPGALTE